MQKLDNVKTKATKKFISIAIVFLLISTLFAYSGGSKGILSNIASNLKEKLDDFEAEKDDNQTKETFLEKTKDKLENTVEKIKELKPKSGKNRVSFLRGFINFLRLKRNSPTGTLFSVYTNYSGNEKTTAIRSGIPKSIDVDDDGDNDIRAFFRIYPRIQRPLILTVNINFKINRLDGFEDPYEFFETRLEFNLPGFLNKNNTADRITFGYQSLKEDEVPDLCNFTYKYIPYLFKKEKSKHNIVFDPGIIDNKYPLALIFGYDNSFNNTAGEIEYSSKSKWNILLDPVIKTDITFGGSDDYVGRQFIFNSSGSSNATIFNERFINGSKSNVGLLINPISSFSYELEVTPLKKGGGRIEYIRNSSEPVNVTLFFERKSIYIYAEGIPQHVNISWTPEKDGVIKLNTYDDRLKTVGISDTKPGPPSFKYKAFLKNLPSLAYIKWNWQPLNGGEIDVYCDRADVSLHFIAHNLLGAPLEISGDLTFKENINMSFFWNFSLKSFGIKRTDSDTNLNLHAEFNNSIFFNFSGDIKRTINGPFEIVFGKLLDGDANITFTSNVLELSDVTLELYIPSIGRLAIECSEMILSKENSGIEFGLDISILGRTLTLDVALEIFNGIILHGLVVNITEINLPNAPNIKDIRFPIKDIETEGHQLYKFSFTVTIANIDKWISEDGSRGYANISGGLSLLVDDTFERPDGTKIGRIAGSINFNKIDGFLNVSFDTVNETRKFNVETRGLAVVSDLQFWIKDKIDFNIPLIVGDFNINMLDKKGEVKLYLSPSSASVSLNINFSLDFLNISNVAFDIDLFVDGELETSGFVGFNWSDGKIKYFSGEGLVGLEGIIGCSDLYIKFDGKTAEDVNLMFEISASKVVLDGDLYADFSFGFLNKTTPEFEIDFNSARLDATLDIIDFSGYAYYSDKNTTLSGNLCVDVDVELSGSGSLGFKFSNGKFEYASGEGLGGLEGTIIVHDSYLKANKKNEKGDNNKFEISVGELIFEGDISADFSIGFLNITQPEFEAELKNLELDDATLDIIDFSLYFYNSTNKNFIDLSFTKLHFEGSANLKIIFEKKLIVGAEVGGAGEFSLEELCVNGYRTSSNLTINRTIEGNIEFGGEGQIGGNLKIDLLEFNADIDIYGDLYLDVHGFSDSYNESQGHIERNGSLFLKATLDGVKFSISNVNNSGFQIVPIEGKLEIAPLEIKIQFSIINETGAAEFEAHAGWDMLYIDADITISFTKLTKRPLKIRAEGEGTILFQGLEFINCSFNVVDKVNVSLKVLDVVHSGSGQFNAEIDITEDWNISVNISGSLPLFSHCNVNFIMDINATNMGINDTTFVLENFSISGPVTWSLTGENLEDGTILGSISSSADDRVSIGKLYIRGPENNSLTYTDLVFARKITLFLRAEIDKKTIFAGIDAEGSASWNCTIHIVRIMNWTVPKLFQNLSSAGSFEGNAGLLGSLNLTPVKVIPIENISGDLDISFNFTAHESTTLSFLDFKCPLLNLELEILNIDVQPGYFLINPYIAGFVDLIIHNESLSTVDVYIESTLQLNIDAITFRTSKHEFILLPIYIKSSNSFALISFDLVNVTLSVETTAKLEAGLSYKTPKHEFNISLYIQTYNSIGSISLDFIEGKLDFSKVDAYFESTSQLELGLLIKTKEHELNIAGYLGPGNAFISWDLINGNANFQSTSQLDLGLFIKTKEHELNFTVYLGPGNAFISWDLDNEIVYLETTSQLEFGFIIKTNKREFRLVDAILHPGTFSIDWNIIDKGHVEFLIETTGTISPEISLIYIKNLITGNSISIAYVTFSTQYVHYKHDIDILSGEPDLEGYIYLDTGGNPLLVGSLKIFDITIIKGSLRAFDFNISWNFSRSNENWKKIKKNNTLDGDCIINVYILDAWRRLWPIGSQAPEMDANFRGNIDINNMKPGDKFRVWVFDPSTNTDISGAKVHYQEKTGPFTWDTYKTLTTDDNGLTDYFTARIPPGDPDGEVDCRILATHENYSLTKMLFHVSSDYYGPGLVVSISYNGDKLFEFEQFTVTVKNSETNSVVQGATVYYRAYNDYGQLIYEESGTTNSNGKVVFTAIEVPQGDADGQISCEAFAEKEDFNPGVEYFVIWDTTANIRGYVYDGEEPLEGLGDVTVTAIDQSNPNNKYVVKTMNIGANKGFYSLEVDPATYKIIYSKTGYQTEIVYNIIAEPGDYIAMPKIYLYPNS